MSGTFMFPEVRGRALSHLEPEGGGSMGSSGGGSGGLGDRRHHHHHHHQQQQLHPGHGHGSLQHQHQPPHPLHHHFPPPAPTTGDFYVLAEFSEQLGPVALMAEPSAHACCGNPKATMLRPSRLSEADSALGGEDSSRGRFRSNGSSEAGAMFRGPSGLPSDDPRQPLNGACTRGCVAELVLRSLSVDYQGHDAFLSGGAPASDAGVVITMGSDGRADGAPVLHAYVHHFTLYDYTARGFVRPLALIYVSRDRGKLVSSLSSLRRAFSDVTRQLRRGNLSVFAGDLAAREADLRATLAAIESQVSLRGNGANDGESGGFGNGSNDTSANNSGGGNGSLALGPDAVPELLGELDDIARKRAIVAAARAGSGDAGPLGLGIDHASSSTGVTASGSTSPPGSSANDIAKGSLSATATTTDEADGHAGGVGGGGGGGERQQPSLPTGDVPGHTHTHGHGGGFGGHGRVLTTLIKTQFDASLRPVHRLVGHAAFSGAECALSAVHRCFRRSAWELRVERTEALMGGGSGSSGANGSSFGGPHYGSHAGFGHPGGTGRGKGSSASSLVVGGSAVCAFGISPGEPGRPAAGGQLNPFAPCFDAEEDEDGGPGLDLSIGETDSDEEYEESNTNSPVFSRAERGRGRAGVHHGHHHLHPGSAHNNNHNAHGGGGDHIGDDDGADSDFHSVGSTAASSASIATYEDASEHWDGRSARHESVQGLGGGRASGGPSAHHRTPHARGRHAAGGAAAAGGSRGYTGYPCSTHKQRQRRRRQRALPLPGNTAPCVDMFTRTRQELALTSLPRYGVPSGVGVFSHPSPIGGGGVAALATPTGSDEYPRSGSGPVPNATGAHPDTGHSHGGHGGHGGHGQSQQPANASTGTGAPAGGHGSVLSGGGTAGPAHPPAPHHVDPPHPAASPDGEEPTTRDTSSDASNNFASFAGSISGSHTGSVPSHHFGSVGVYPGGFGGGAGLPLCNPYAHRGFLFVRDTLGAPVLRQTVYSLLRGRPVVIIAPPELESLSRALVSILATCVPGGAPGDGLGDRVRCWLGYGGCICRGGPVITAAQGKSATTCAVCYGRTRDRSGAPYGQQSHHQYSQQPGGGGQHRGKSTPKQASQRDVSHATPPAPTAATTTAAGSSSNASVSSRSSWAPMTPALTERLPHSASPRATPSRTGGRNNNNNSNNNNNGNIMNNNIGGNNNGNMNNNHGNGGRGSTPMRRAPRVRSARRGSPHPLSLSSLGTLRLVAIDRRLSVPHAVRPYVTIVTVREHGNAKVTGPEYDSGMLDDLFPSKPAAGAHLCSDAAFSAMLHAKLMAYAAKARVVYHLGMIGIAQAAHSPTTHADACAELGEREGSQHGSQVGPTAEEYINGAVIAPAVAMPSSAEWGAGKAGVVANSSGPPTLPPVTVATPMTPLGTRLVPRTYTPLAREGRPLGRITRGNPGEYLPPVLESPESLMRALSLNPCDFSIVASLARSVRDSLVDSLAEAMGPAAAEALPQCVHVDTGPVGTVGSKER